MQMADLICYMKLRKKFGLRAFIFFSLSRVVRGDLRQAPFIFLKKCKIFFSHFDSQMKENDLTLAETSFELFSIRYDIR